MRATDAAGIVRLLGLGARGVRSIVERTHLAVQQSTYRVAGTRAEPVGRAHDGYVAGIHRLVDLGLLGAEKLAHAAVLRRVVGDDALTDSNRAAYIVAVINGLYGDRLHGEKHALAPGITLRTGQADVPLTADGLAAAYPDAADRLVVFVHGLMETDTSWSFRSAKRHGEAGASYASLLTRDTGRTSLLVRYNTGRPIADNGLALGALLDSVVRHWPVPVRDIVLVGHSMGGLVVHSALAQTSSDWAELVSSTVTLGTPYLGAPLERGAAALARQAEKLPPARWLADLVTSRSEGIKDLGAGLGPHAELPQDAEHARRHYLVFATLIPGGAGRLRDLTGDVIVPTSSAAGGYELPFADDERVTVLHLPGLHHMDLLNVPVLYEHLRGWLGDDTPGT